MRGSSREILEEGDLRIEFGDFPPVFSTFDQLCAPVSLWNHQKWIPREIPHRYGSEGLLKPFFFNKNSWKIVENRQNRLPDPRTYYGDPHCNFWLGTFSPRNFPDPKQSPEQKWGSECSDQAKKWVGSAQGWYLKNCRTDFFVFVSCSKKNIFFARDFSKIPKISGLANPMSTGSPL